MTGDEKAKRQLLLLTFLKLSGAVVICCGLYLVMQPDRFGLDQKIGSIAGGIIMLLGLAELAIMPRLLRRSFDEQNRP
jgi:hypothetical protein